MNTKLFLIIQATVGIFTSCSSKEDTKIDTLITDSIKQVNFEIIDTFPHEITHFTEGLEFHNGILFESTGSPEELINTESLVGKINLETGKMDEKIRLNKNKYFGEGITILENRLYQVTYKSKTCFVYDLKTFKKIATYSFSNTEGWGLTNDGKSIIMSDGSHNLTFFDPKTFKVVKTLPVTMNNYGQNNLNELEFIDNFIYANIWQKDEIVKISPSTGKVVASIDCKILKKDAISRYSGSMETNGIAYDDSSKTILITGKLWPLFYRLKVIQ